MTENHFKPPAMAVAAATLAVLMMMQSPTSAADVNDCMQENTSSLALRACTELLAAPGLSSSLRITYLARRAKAWIIEDEPAEAIADYSRILDIAPGDRAALTGRARANTIKGLHGAAADDWSALMAKDTPPPDKETLLLERGRSLLAAGKPESALSDFSKALELNPKSINAHLERGNAYAVTKDKERALAEFAAAEMIDPADALPSLWRARAAEMWGEPVLAIENYKLSTRLNPRAAWEARKSLKRLGVDTPP